MDHAVRIKRSIQQFEQRCFSGTILSDQPAFPAGIENKRHVGKQRIIDRFVRKAQMIDGNHWHTIPPPKRPRRKLPAVWCKHDKNGSNIYFCIVKRWKFSVYFLSKQNFQHLLTSFVTLIIANELQKGKFIGYIAPIPYLLLIFPVSCQQRKSLIL